MYKFIQKMLDWGVKIASLAVTGPATWDVATRLFAQVESPILLFVMRFAAVFLVEGVLLSNWLLLEFDKNATPEIKVRYGITAMTMYVALLVIAWEHEGPVGLVFRIALLAALIGSGWDTYVYTWQRMTASVDRSPENSGKVKRHARTLAIRESIMRREAEHSVTRALIEAEAHASLHHTGLYRERLLASNEVQHKSESLRILDEDERIESQANGKKKRLQQLSPPAMGAGLRRLQSPGRNGLGYEGLPLKPSLLAALANDPDISMVDLSNAIGFNVDVVTAEVNTMVEDGLVERQGNRLIVVAGAQSRGNGQRLKGRVRR
jgi:hypothetical protein